MPKQVSFRQPLHGMLTDFVRDAGFDSAVVHDVACELVFLLAAYREEEVPLFPEVYLIQGAEAADALATIAPGGERIELGSCPPQRNAASEALKHCAAIASGGWSVYIRSEPEGFSYGVFLAYQLPFSVGASESLRSPGGVGSPVILFRNCAANCVELVDGTGQHLEISLTSSPVSGAPVSTQITLLAQAACSDVESGIRDVATGYFARLLSEICQTSHGTLIGVIPHSKKSLPAILKDGVSLLPPVDIVAAIQAVLDRHDDAALALLRSREALLRGMISSDGITVLGSNGTVRGFRVFVKPTAAESKQIADHPSGGARTRAFEVMKLRLGRVFTTVFYQSQDGRTACMRGDE